MTSDLRLWFLSDCLPCFHFFFFFFFLFTLIRMTLILGDSLPPSFHFSILFLFLLSYHCLLPTGQRERRLHCFFQYFHIHYIILFFVFHVHYWTDLFCLILPCFTLFYFLFSFYHSGHVLGDESIDHADAKAELHYCAHVRLQLVEGLCSVCVCVCVCVCVHMGTRERTCGALTHARTHIDIHIDTHTRARAHTHTHAHAHAHTLKWSNCSKHVCSWALHTVENCRKHAHL